MGDPGTIGGPAADPGHSDAALGAGEACFRNLFEKNADGVIVVRRDDGVIRLVNPAAEELLGRPAGSLLGEVFGIPVVPGETTEVDIPRPGGWARIAEMRTVATEWAEEPVYLATLRDVTERKRLVDALRILAEASALLAHSLDLPTTLAGVARLAVAHLADGCLVDLLERDRTIQRAEVAHADPTAAARAHELKGFHALDVGATGGLPQVLRTGRPEVHPYVSDAVLETLAPGIKPLRTIRALGCRSLLILPLVAHGRTLGAITLLATAPGRRFGEADVPLAEEVASRAALAIDNARLYDEAQEAVRRRDQFLAMLAHELRNPLSPILNAAAVLRLRVADEPQVLRGTDVIERQGRRMARLIDDLLDISRVTRGKIALRKEPVALSAVVAAAVDGTVPLIEARGHQLSVALPEEPIRLEADSTRLEQVIVNLLTNAAKYTAPGGRLWLSATAEGASVVVRVRDTGVGIPAAMLPRVFDLFVQADHSLDRAQGGLGIGLTLVRSLVELHGGTVAAFSAGPGQGSEFVVRLPRGSLEEVRPAAAVAAAAASGLRILIVEDQQDNREMLGELLRLWGHHVELAEDGPQGVEAIARLRPDVALVDIGLPALDGYQVAERVRAAAHGPDVVLVALTGYAQPEDRRRVHAAGFNAHLAKPVDLDELARLLASIA